ncbi:MAG: primosomal protein N' [Chthoniobacteraceae bacterium]|nr:primosomal protein N' [Chthoniobacteraceae bacterium]
MSSLELQSTEFALEVQGGRFVRVILDDSGSRVFDYAVPEGVEVARGCRVRVPVRRRTVLGTVLEVTTATEASGVRFVSEVLKSDAGVNPALLELAVWMADYYACPLENALRAVLPQVIRKLEMTHQERQAVRLVEMPADEILASLEKRAPLQLAALRALEAEPGLMAVAELAKRTDASHAVVRALEKKGWVAVESQRVDRDPTRHEQFIEAPPLALNAEQEVVFQKVCEALVPRAPDAAAPKPFLLHGVTGSGKTEIYLQAIQRVLEQGRSAIMLVPEISLTPQTVERFKSRFAATQHEVAVLHSHLSEGERHDEWHRIRSGKARIVIGARSAVFAPVEKLGLIVVDEEHEPSYKQEESPRYHGRDIAVLRGFMERCAVLLGSATPSLESYHNVKLGKYDLLTIKTRVDDKKLPYIRIVDMRMESKKQSAIISSKLLTALQQRIERREQSILFLNRRGFSTSMLCEKCGNVCQCPNCSVSLTFHKAANRLVCHTCGYIALAPTKCPECKDPGIRQQGTGTERVEDVVQKLFPKAVVRRLDADVLQRKAAFRETLAEFRVGKIDILVGTQMIAKGLHFPNVTLVGIINADLGLHLPDFRAGERTFQLLTQVAGRAGRGDVEGEVFVQSFTPFSPAIQFSRHHDFEGFWEQEIDFRRQWNYPPFTHLVLLSIRSPHQGRGELSAQTLAKRIAEDAPPGLILSEATPAPLEKSHGQFRFHLMLRTKSVPRLSRYLRAILDKLPFPEDVTVTVDVDAYQLM